ncbi:MAG TPA: LpxD N-terminal domain-containing protein, partial [Rhodanobacteraceae bacterium]|nr:LpxD N-terminal domain-containing protein [Rhodanobacteraceae bacterium]
MSNESGYRIADLAQRFNLELRGDGSASVRGVGTLAAAGPDQLAFLANPRYASMLAGTRAGVVVLRAEHAEGCPVPALIAADPYLAYAKVAALFEHIPASRPGIHPTAVVESGTRIAESASIGPFCTIAADAVIEDGATLGPHCVIGEGCVVGAQSRLVARV